MPKKNYTFSCSHNRESVEPHRLSISDASCYTDREKLDLFEFYVVKALVKTCKLGGVLSDLGWKGAELGRLEKLFVELCGLENRFLIARTDKMPKTLERFGLNIGMRICIDCPRGVMLAECQVVEGIVRPKGNATRVEVILSHIRNSIAHGNTFFFDNGNVLLLDVTRQGDKSCALLIPSRALVDFMQTVNNGPNEASQASFTAEGDA